MFHNVFTAHPAKQGKGSYVATLLLKYTLNYFPWSIKQYRAFPDRVMLCTINRFYLCHFSRKASCPSSLAFLYSKHFKCYHFNLFMVLNSIFEKVFFSARILLVACLVRNSLYIPGRPSVWGNLPASFFQLMGLQVCSTMSGLMESYKFFSAVFRHTILDLPLVVGYFLYLSCYLVPFPLASQTSQGEIAAADMEVHVCNPSLWSFQMEHQELRLQWDIVSSLNTAWASGDPTSRNGTHQPINKLPSECSESRSSGQKFCSFIWNVLLSFFKNSCTGSTAHWEVFSYSTSPHWEVFSYSTSTHWKCLLCAVTDSHGEQSHDSYHPSSVQVTCFCFQCLFFKTLSMSS